MIIGQLPRREGINRAPADILRQTGIGQHRDVLGGIDAEVTHSIVHLLGPGGAVQADGVHVIRFQRGQRGADFGAQQHGPGGFQRDLHLHRKPPPFFPHHVERRNGRNLGLQQVLAGLDQQNVHAGIDQRGYLLNVGGTHVVEADVLQRRQLRRRANGAGHKARFARRGIVRRDGASEFDRLGIQFGNAILETVLGQHNARSTEGIGFDYVAADLQEGCMNVANDIRTAEHQQFIAALLAPVVVGGGVAKLNIGPHGAVVNDNALIHRLEEITHKCNPLNSCCVILRDHRKVKALRPRLGRLLNSERSEGTREPTTTLGRTVPWDASLCSA